jgi:hypothetical protein
LWRVDFDSIRAAGEAVLCFTRTAVVEDVMNWFLMGSGCHRPGQRDDEDGAEAVQGRLRF